MSNDPNEDKKSEVTDASVDSDGVKEEAKEESSTEQSSAQSTVDKSSIEEDEEQEDLDDDFDEEDEPSDDKDKDEDEDLDDFYEKPVLIGLGLFVLLIIAVMIQKAPSVDSPSTKSKQAQEKKEKKAQKKEKKAQKEQANKKSAAAKKTDDSAKKPAKSTPPQATKSSSRSGLKSVDRVGKVNFSVDTAAVQTQQACVYSVDMSSFDYLSESALSKLGLSGVQLLTVK